MQTAQTLRALVSEYILQHDIRETSADQYHRISGVFSSWLIGNPSCELPASDFTARNVSRFLAAKQAAGRSSHYRRSLRNCLSALLKYSGDFEKVRPVKTDELDPHAWQPEEVAKLIAACDRLRGGEKRRERWRLLIAVAYYTGLAHIDLRKLRREDFGPDGLLRCKRSKTGRRVVASIPIELLARLPEGELFPLESSLESFRATFRRLVKWAGIRGTFKTLRKTAGTLVDEAHPGQGHVLLANSRAIFEAHYLARAAVPAMPPRLPEVSAPNSA